MSLKNTLTKVSENQCFGGRQLRFKHQSSSVNGEMTFAIYLPEQAKSQKVPILYWLSGLTCTDENFIQKSGFQRYAAEHGIAVVCPDTSPRGEGVPDDVNGAYDFGLGAGFYINATQAPFDQHYQMYYYVVNELPALINDSFSVDGSRISISGHSMGGHGALMIALKNSEKYKSVSAFSPIVSPMNCPWGKKALSRYLGDNKADWQHYDSCALVAKSVKQLPLLIDQGNADDFLVEQLKPELFAQACELVSYDINLRMQEGYDHSYFFISSFIGEHIAFHAEHLIGCNANRINT
jgi:S-formylglutathione hydrolase